MRKFEIYLPLSYVDGKPIEEEKIRSVRDELVNEFGSFTTPDRTAWRYDSVGCVKIMKVEIIIAGNRVPTKFLKDFKKSLKESFQVTDILITTHRVHTA